MINTPIKGDHVPKRLLSLFVCSLRLNSPKADVILLACLERLIKAFIMDITETKNALSKLAAACDAVNDTENRQLLDLFSDERVCVPQT